MRFILLLFLFCIISSCRKDVGKSNPMIDPGNETMQILRDSNQTSDTVKTPVTGLEIGNKAPEINLKDSNNAYVSLSSLKDKIVLVDFWASWCAPCRFENRKLVKVYSKFKDTTFKTCVGFEIYSVSIDIKKIGWLNCMKNEKYNWRNNVLDENYAAQSLYKVNSIPTNFLLDKDGIIIAKNLRDTSVDRTLIGLLK